MPINCFDDCSLADAGSIAIFEFWNTTPHLETGLEIAARLATEVASQVHYCSWGHTLLFTESYVQDNKRLLTREKKAFELLQDFMIWDEGLPLGQLTFPHITDHYLRSSAHLKRLQYKNTPIGRTIHCTLCDITRDLSPGLIEYRHAIQLMANQYVTIYENTKHYVCQHSIRSSVLFNGRHLTNYAAFEALRSCSCTAYFHERGPTQNHYVFLPERVQNIEMLQSQLQSVWVHKLESDVEAFSEAARIVLARRNGECANTAAFRHFQQKGHLSQIFNSNRQPFITFFASTIDENNLLPDPSVHPNGYWDDQRLAVIDLVTVASQHPCKPTVVIRLHPNNLNKSSGEQSLWDFLQLLDYPDLHVISPDSQVDSYELAEASDYNLVWYSSFGADIMSLGKCVYAMNGAEYDYMDSCIVLNGPMNIRQILDQYKPMHPSRSLSARRDALQYFYSRSHLACDHVFYEPLGVDSGKFLGLSL